MNLRDGSIDHEKATNPKMMTMRVRAFLYKRNNIILCEKKKKEESNRIVWIDRPGGPMAIPTRHNQTVCENSIWNNKNLTVLFFFMVWNLHFNTIFECITSSLKEKKVVKRIIMTPPPHRILQWFSVLWMTMESWNIAMPIKWRRFFLLISTVLFFFSSLSLSTISHCSIKTQDNWNTLHFVYLYSVYFWFS